MSDLTPMLKQYYEIKEKHHDAILMFRLGDFYEMFGDDAKKAANILDIVLTARNKGSDLKIPMCGVPHHAVDSYITKLVKAGLKVAICDQIEDPALAKGIVKREVTRIVTPGTLDSNTYLQATQNNYLLCLYPAPDSLGIAWCDVSTGEIFAKSIENSLDLQVNVLQAELARIRPSEIIMPESIVQDENKHPLVSFLQEYNQQTLFPFSDWAYLGENAILEIKKQFGVQNLDGLGLAENEASLPALGALLAYLADTQKQALKHIAQLKVEHDYEHMYLDASTIRSLELVENLQNSDPKACLLGVLQKGITTSMGHRLLRQWLLHPLIDLQKIQARLDAVETLFKESSLRTKLIKHLDKLGDLERLASRLGMSRIQPKEVIRLKESLELIPTVQEELQQALDSGSNKQTKKLSRLVRELELLPNIIEKIVQTLVDDPPAVSIKGGLIKQGFHAELDELVEIKTHGKTWIKNLEQSEKKSTGINSLKVKYNKVFGYYIEVTNTNLDLVPEHYIRKQTLVNAERFITPELKEHEAKVLGAEERIVQIEQDLYAELIANLQPYLSAIQQDAHVLAQLDVLCGLAEVARVNMYCKPQINDDDALEITEGRHPVVERLAQGERFIPNDALVKSSHEQIIVLTGPNMAGKSTWLRQIALISLMAQMGSYVPAKHARLGIVDRIFTRIGASDDLARGQSTFMVEMQETANILNNATDQSLIILDEIGRGTSTYDGLAIAWAVIEYLHGDKSKGPKTLFATHYHELIQLADELPRVKNYNIAVREFEGNVVFLRKILPGGVDRSYGIQVAQLAGLPPQAVARAKQILEQIEQSSDDLDSRLQQTRDSIHSRQMGFLANENQPKQSTIPKPHPAVEALKEIKVETLTPLEALNKLAELKKKSEA